MAGKRERGEAGVAELRGRLESWRRKRSGRNMPEELWRAAAEVAESEGISAVARALGLNYGNLKRRVRGSERRAKQGLGAQPLFVELGRAAAVVEPRCVFEIEDRRGGRRMAIRFEGHGPAELAALGGALWKACR